jgi:hypothetical protein
VDESCDIDLDELLIEIAEIGVGATILGLRRLNIERRRLVKEIPTLEPVVDSVLDRIDALAQPVSSVMGAAVAGIGDALDGERGEQLRNAGQTIAEMGPELIRLSGLTKRD